MKLRGNGPRIIALVIVLIILAAVFLLQFASTFKSASPNPKPTATPLPTPTKVPGFPVTSATLRNRAGINAMPGMRPVTYYGPNPDGWWCTPPNCFTPTTTPLQMIDREMALIARLHIGILRVEFDWPLIEPGRGVFRWSRGDAIVLAADRYGIQLQPVLVYTPKWAGPGPLVAPTQTAWWTEFVRKVVTRYRNSVHYWELWNEPDGGGYWLDSEGKYVNDILIPGAHAVRTADPSARVLLGEPYFADAAFLDGIYAAGGGRAFDIAGFHEYANVLGQGGIQHDVDTIRSILNQHGQGSKPVWIGEYGFREASATTNDANHVAAMRIMLEHVHGYQEAIWYNLRDDDAMACCPPTVVKVAHWGIVKHNDSTVKRGYAVMRRIITLLPH